jgi:hypothetical protein
MLFVLFLQKVLIQVTWSSEGESGEEEEEKEDPVKHLCSNTKSGSQVFFSYIVAITVSIYRYHILCFTFIHQ